MVSVAPLALRELADLRRDAALAQAERGAAAARSAAWEAAQSALSELAAGDPPEAATALHERGWILAGKPGEEAPPTEAPKKESADSPLVRATAPPAPPVD